MDQAGILLSGIKDLLEVCGHGYKGRLILLELV